ncbi:hypothetical protein [Flavobacterium sp. HNIBRBA15423]|uniref:hypothetical protein n=1 Tax=Flavobacterium sp. HNIBRBA15423 TaxID=3458683 RepID=UPI004044EB5E
MQKTVVILILLIPILIFGQNTTDFAEIENIQYFHPRLDYSLADTLNLKTWKNFKKGKKEKIKENIISLANDIKNDTLELTQILLYGKKQPIRLIVNNSIIFDQTLTDESQKYAYIINDYPSDDKTFEITSIKRNSGIVLATLILFDSKKIVNFKMDTAYSGIYLNTQNILVGDINENIESFDKNIVGDYGNKELPVAPKKIEVVDEEYGRITIDHKIKRGKHSW